MHITAEMIQAVRRDGGDHEEAAKARFEDRELLRQFQEVESLPDDDELVVKKLLDAFLTKKQIQLLAGEAPLERRQLARQRAASREECQPLLYLHYVVGDED